jgi:hypothetical protein
LLSEPTAACAYARRPPVSSKAGDAEIESPAYRHLPLTQLLPFLQVLPQPPQLLSSFDGSTQMPSQPVCPVGQTNAAQAPLTHAWPDLHFLLHAPQCAGSPLVSTQSSLQIVCPGAHAPIGVQATLPAVEVVPLGQARQELPPVAG